MNRLPECITYEAINISITTPCSFELGLYLAIERFYKRAIIPDNTDNSDPKWWHGLERQRRHPCATNQRRPQKKHHSYDL